MLLGGLHAVVESGAVDLQGRVGTAVGDGQKFTMVNQLLCAVHITVAEEFVEVKSALTIFVKDMDPVTDAARAAGFTRPPDRGIGNTLVNDIGTPGIQVTSR